MSGDLLFRPPYIPPRRNPDQKFPYVAESLDEFDFQKFSDTDNLFQVMRELRFRGKLAPGIDNIHFHDLSHPEWFDVFRTAENVLRSENYRPNRLREVKFEKPSGGHRILQIPTVLDRTISRALHVAVKNAWEKQYPGFTPSRYKIFREFERALQESGRRVLRTADIINCFPSVKMDDVLRAHRQIVADKLLLRVIAQVVLGHDGRAKIQGLAQGCPYSPTAMEVTLRSALHAKWQSVPYQWHYIDDFVFLCESKRQGKELFEDFRSAIRGLGMTLRDTGCADLSRERKHQVPVLGLCPSWTNEECRWWIPASTWRRLGRRLTACREYSEPHRAAKGLIDGFISSIGPAVRRDAISLLSSRISNRLKGSGFTRLGPTSIEEALLAARTKWLKYRDQPTPSRPTPLPPVTLMEDNDTWDDSVPPF